MKAKDSAFIIADVQNDFCEGGALAVKGANAIIPVINEIRKQNYFDFNIVVYDWHPNNHASFESKEAKAFSTITCPITKAPLKIWPVHCVQNSKGAELHKDLITHPSDIIIRKGTLKEYDSFSSFGTKYEDTGLSKKLKELKIKKTFIVGLAFDFCVKSSALDSKAQGLETYVILDGTASVFKEKNADNIKDMEGQGIKIIQSKDIKNFL